MRVIALEPPLNQSALRNMDVRLTIGFRGPQGASQNALPAALLRIGSGADSYPLYAANEPYLRA